jgi:hypothetical protein
MKIQVAKWGTPKKYLKKRTVQLFTKRYKLIKEQSSNTVPIKNSILHKKLLSSTLYFMNYFFHKFPLGIFKVHITQQMKYEDDKTKVTFVSIIICKH